MSDKTVRSLLSLCIVIPYGMVMLVLLIALAGFTDISPEKAMDIGGDFMGLYSGVVGMVVGYYFGTRANSPAKSAAETREKS